MDNNQHHCATALATKCISILKCCLCPLLCHITQCDEHALDEQQGSLGLGQVIPQQEPYTTCGLPVQAAGCCQTAVLHQLSTPGCLPV